VSGRKYKLSETLACLAAGDAPKPEAWDELLRFDLKAVVEKRREKANRWLGKSDVLWAVELELLGNMCRPGPEGGRPQLVALVEWIRKSAKDEQHAVATFHKQALRELDDMLEEVSGDPKPELRRRLLEALKDWEASGGGETDEERQCWGRPGMETVGTWPIEEAAKELGVQHSARHAKGRSAKIPMPLPTPGQIREILGEIFSRCDDRLRFGNLLGIVEMVFGVSSGAVVSLDAQGDGGDDGPGPLKDVIPCKENERDRVRRADRDHPLVGEIIRLIENLDKGAKFPKGNYGRLFVTCFLWQDEQEETQCFKRLGWANSTAHDRMKKLGRAVRKLLGDQDRGEILDVLAYFRLRYVDFSPDDSANPSFGKGQEPAAPSHRPENDEMS